MLIYISIYIYIYGIFEHTYIYILNYVLYIYIYDYIIYVCSQYVRTKSCLVIFLTVANNTYMYMMDDDYGKIMVLNPNQVITVLVFHLFSMLCSMFIPIIYAEVFLVELENRKHRPSLGSTKPGVHQCSSDPEEQSTYVCRVI